MKTVFDPDPEAVSITFEVLDASSNAYLLRTPQHVGLLDAGKVDAANAWVEEMMHAPDWIWLSHVHADHVASWPKIFRTFGQIPTTTSKQTRRWLAQHLTSQYDEMVSQSLCTFIQTPDDLSTWSVPGARHINAMIKPSGHIPGASSLWLDIPHKEKFHRICYLSDFCLHDQPMLAGAALKSWPQVDTLIMETALAYNKNLTGDQAIEGWANAEVVMRNHEGAMLWAVTKYGEAQQLMAMANAMGLTPVVHESLDALAFDVVSASTVTCKALLTSGHLVIAPGSNLEIGTPAHALVWPLLLMRDGLLVLSNHQRGGQLSRLILDGQHKAQFKWKGQRFERRAQVEHVQLINHAPLDDLVRAVSHLNPAQVVLVHGARRGFSQMRRSLREAGFGGRIIVPKQNERITLV